MNPALAEEGSWPNDNYDIIRTDLSVIILGREDVPDDIIERILQCCHVDLLVYHVK